MLPSSQTELWYLQAQMHLFSPFLSLLQCDSKLPVSLQNIQIKNVYSQPARWDQRSLRSFLHSTLPEGKNVWTQADLFSISQRNFLHRLSSLSFHFRDIWSTGMSRGRCGTTCLEKRCLRFILHFILTHRCLKIFILSDFHAIWILYVQVDFADTSIIITEPYFNFSSIQESMNEILFEEYQFQSALRINGKSI